MGRDQWVLPHQTQDIMLSKIKLITILLLVQYITASFLPKMQLGSKFGENDPVLDCTQLCEGLENGAAAESCCSQHFCWCFGGFTVQDKCDDGFGMCAAFMSCMEQAQCESLCDCFSPNQ